MIFENFKFSFYGKWRAQGWAICALLAMATPAHALNFSPDCRDHQQVPVIGQQNAILFTKQPVPHPNGDATVFSIDDNENIVIPAGHNSCVYAIAAPSNDNYCFIARNDNTILTVGAGGIVNPGGLQACQ